MATASTLLKAREARPATASANLRRTAVQAALFWLVFFVAIPAALLWCERRLFDDAWSFAGDAWRAAGVLIFLAAGALNIRTAVALAVDGEGTPLPLASPRRLVVRGPYRWVRNPMAVSALLQGVGVGLALGSPLVLGYVLTGALLWQTLVRPWEERDLERRFGADYRAYRQQVRCWIPRLHAHVPGQE